MLLKTLWAVFLNKDQSTAGVHMLFSSTFITVQKEHLEKCNQIFATSTCLHEVPLLETV